TGSKGAQDLGTLTGGNVSAAMGINGIAQVVGWSATGSSFAHAFLWTKTGGMQDLGRLPGGTLSISNGINSAGTVVGYSDQNNQFGINHAFVWTVTGGMQDLNSLIPAGVGWSLTYANAINDAGQIVGICTVLG